MKTSFAVASSLVFVIVTDACAADIRLRQLQNFPPTNNQGPFRPVAPVGPNGLQSPFAGGPPFQSNGLGQGPVPVNAQGPLQQTGQEIGNPGVDTGARESDMTGPSDAMAEAGPSPAAPTTADASAPATPTVVPTSGEIAPGQPTIMVIVPDFLAAGSGWSSYSDDVSATKTSPPTEAPKEETPTSSAPATMTASTRLLTLAATIVGALGVSSFAG